MYQVSPGSLYFYCMKSMAHPFPPSKNPEENGRDHFVFKSLINSSELWDSSLFPSLYSIVWFSLHCPGRRGLGCWHTGYCSMQEKQMKTGDGCQRACVGVVSRLKKSQEALFSFSQMLEILYILQIHMWQEREYVHTAKNWVPLLVVSTFELDLISKYGKS